MRDRLVDLLDVIIQPGEKTLGDIADCLYKNNVIALYCNVGDKVYENYRGNIFEYVVTSIEILSSYKIVYKVQAADPCNRLVRFIGFDKYDIGATIFLTREDAKKDLNRGRIT